jgi:hypothetical protein
MQAQMTMCRLMQASAPHRTTDNTNRMTECAVVLF